MAEEIMETTVDNEVDYIKAIKDLKENTVSKDQYLKLKQENKKLIQSLVEGTGEVSSAPAPTREALEAKASMLRQKLFKRNASTTNLETWDTALQLRDTLLELGHPDPFIPMGQQISATDADIATANKVATVLQECVDYSDGNPSVFQSELQRVVEDTPAIMRRRK